ncbi:response regulator transcription factor [Virgibacillus sp. C22-A2]|uniref:Response regulator transcription factor n=1 Tax=Virgibacillus tibetensis TaxID=3042313 RepID=A0ABU6KF74_9BACI|nr:response regulator transcription factor [Virgibacillus sp. C22-A2]
MASEKILLVDDDFDMREVVKLYLEKNGYTVYTAEGGVQAMNIVGEVNPELIVLDVMMPHLDGFELCQIIRKQTDVPILFLSSKDEDMDKILGLGIGGDDYIPKSTSMPVIVAKIKAHLRRNRVLLQEKNDGNVPLSTQPKSVINYPGLVIRLDSATVIANGATVKLSAKEYRLLCLMAGNPERVYSMEQLFELVWGVNSLGDYRTVMVHISNIRKKIEIIPETPKYIKTLRGIGYKFNGAYAE